MGVLKFAFHLYNDFKFELLALKFVAIIFERWPFSVEAFFLKFFLQWKERRMFLCGQPLHYIMYIYIYAKQIAQISQYR